MVLSHNQNTHGARGWYNQREEHLQELVNESMPGGR